MNKNLNLTTRIYLYSICTSLEFDIKNFILKYNSNPSFSEEMLDKAQKRSKNANIRDVEEILNQLDLDDYIHLLELQPFSYRLNNQKIKTIRNYFEKIIGIRNRVMHTKPIEMGDRAILTEVLEGIDSDLPFISWNSISELKKTLKDNPQMLLQKYENRHEYFENVYHNLPEPEFDDTGYIGRKHEINEITELLLDDRRQIISIIGDGGIGKTAIAVKVLYDLIDNPKNSFKYIIWLSLKTKTLSKGEFIQIDNYIKTTIDIENYGKNLYRIDNSISPKEDLLTFMNKNNTLLVLDNLETINDNEINDFIKKVPVNSKVLITSRNGIGEIEYRYKLLGMNKDDAINYFRELSKYYGLNLHKKTDEIIYSVIKKQLYSSPLSIKWYITGIHNGISEKTLFSMAQKNKLVEFCMSNVYNKLLKSSKLILQLFQIENMEITYGQIYFYMDLNEDTIIKSLNELLATSMILILGDNYILNDMAKDYLNLNHPPSDEFAKEIQTKKKQLNTIIQNVRITKENYKYSPKALCSSDKSIDTKIASYYLTKSLECGYYRDYEGAMKNIDIAISIAPNYFECYKIKAFLSAEFSKWFDSITNYEKALLKCENDEDKAIVLYLISYFYTVKYIDYDKALDYILDAEKLLNNEFEINLQKAKVYIKVGKFDDAEIILNSLEKETKLMGKTTQNILAVLYADMYIHKIDLLKKDKDNDQKFEYIKLGISKIEELSDIDGKTYVSMIKLLCKLSYIADEYKYFKFLYDILKRHYVMIRKNKHKDVDRLRENILNKEYRMSTRLYGEFKRLLYDYTKDGKKIIDKNKGIIVFIDPIKKYGFINNSLYDSLYFNIIHRSFKFKIGDIVTFDIQKNYKGDIAINLKSAQEYIKN